MPVFAWAGAARTTAATSARSSPRRMPAPMPSAGSDRAEVAHVDLVRSLIVVERCGGVEHDVVSVEAHARVLAASVERHGLFDDRLHERDVADVRVEVRVRHPVVVAHPREGVDAEVAGLRLEAHVVARVADHRVAGVAVAERAVARADDLLALAEVLAADLLVAALLLLVGHDLALDVVVGGVLTATCDEARPAARVA